jgi:hypothetical protein
MTRTPEGIPILELRYWADPDKNPAWAAREEAKYTNKAIWRREMLGEAHALSGQRVYPEFDVATHVIADDKIPRVGCRFMAIDPHPRTPHAFLWILVDQWNDWYAYRELWPSVVYGDPRMLKDSDEEKAYTIHDYAETLALLEGNRIEWHHAEDGDEYGVYRKMNGGEKVLERYMDQAGKAFKASDEASRIETYARRYSRYGIDCRDPRKSHEAGEDAIRDLLKPRRHDQRGVWPKLHVAASLAELTLEFLRHRYKPSRTFSDEKDLKQDAVEARSHLLDLLRYLACADFTFMKSAAS